MRTHAAFWIVLGAVFSSLPWWLGAWPPWCKALSIVFICSYGVLAWKVWKA